eukprot:324544_1
MVEIMSSTGFEEPWVQVSKDEVQRQQKFGSSYGVGRRISGGITSYTAKLPASSSVNGKTIKLGVFRTSEEAAAAVQHALSHPEFQIEATSASESLMGVSNEIMEPSFCELVVPKKREYKDKI